MDTVELLELFLQADSATAAQAFDEAMRAMARFAFLETMCEEAAMHCGPRYARGVESAFFRSGSAQGTVFLGDRSEPVQRPRVRERLKDGSTKEKRLVSYEAGRDGAALREAILRSFTAGVSARKIADVTSSKRRTSRSEVSRLWEQKGAEYVKALRERLIGEEAYVVLMIDGVVLSSEITVLVALGITDGGEKRMLDFEIGSSENAVVVEALTDRLVERGLRPAGRRFLIVLDGSAALRRGVRKHWPEALIQTCLVHVERRIRGRLARRWHGELVRGFNRLRKASSYEAACEAFDALERFVGSHSAEGVKTLRAAREEMLTLFSLGAPDTFNKPLLTTNSIENSIGNMRRLLGRVARWRAETDMASRWTACAMLEAEKGMNRIQGHREMHLLVEAINRAGPENSKQKTAAYRECTTPDSPPC